jgi:predicted transposase/invertase (TIGR01784 family)
MNEKIISQVINQIMNLIPAFHDTFIHFLFGTPGNERFLLSFINAILEADNQKPVVSVKMTNPFNPQTFAKDKYTILDVKAIDEGGGIFVIEFQSWKHMAFEERLYYYCCKTFCLQIKVGYNYDKLVMVIGIAIVAYPLNDDKLPGVLSSFSFTCKKNQERVFANGNGIEIHLLEVTDEKAELFSTLPTSLRSWANFFHYSHRKSEQEMMLLLETPETREAYKQYLLFNQDDELRALDNAHEQFMIGYSMDIDVAHQTGIAEGEIRGEIRGEIKGKVEGKVEDALSMKRLGFNASDIMKVTGLSFDEIERLA